MRVEGCRKVLESVCVCAAGARASLVLLQSPLPEAETNQCGGPNKKVTPHSAATLPLKMESSSATDRVSRPAPPYGATFRYPFQVLQKRFFRQSLRNVHLPLCGGAFRYPAEVGTETILQTALHGIHTSAVSPR
jgi:hypothetical protein